MGKTPRAAETVSASIDHVLLVMATRLKDARLRSEMTQKQVAELAGVQQSYVYEIETGKTNITIRTLARLAEVLQIDIRALLPNTTSPGDGSTPYLDLQKAISELQDLEKLDADHHKRRSALLDEIKSGLGVAIEAGSVQDLAPAKAPIAEAETNTVKRTGRSATKSH